MRALLPLELKGTGTRDVEALPSYLVRLAAVHGVSPGGLFQYLLSGVEEGQAVGAALSAQPLAAAVRPNATTERTIEVLSRGKCEAATPLRCSTFLHLAPALARSPGSYNKHVRWCPGCFHDQVLEDGTPYLKLPWFFSDVQACDRHHLVLRDRCPHCNRSPATGRWWPTFAECPRCDERLDVVHASDRVEHDPEAHAPDLIALVEDIACRDTPFPAGATNRFVNDVFDAAWAGEREIELWEKLPRDECLRYSAPAEPITLPIARRIAFRLEISIAELLGGNLPSIRSFGFAADAPLPQPMRPGSRGRSIDRVGLKKALKRLLASSCEPMSLRQAARHLNVSVGALSYHCGELAAELVQRRAAFQRAESTRKQTRAAHIVRMTVANWAATDESMSKKALLRRLFPASGLPKNLLLAAINEHWEANSKAKVGANA